MSDTDAPTNDAPDEPPEGDETRTTFDADYVKKLRDEAAKHRKEAKANADAAKRLAELEDAQKSEAEKAADRMRQLEAEVAEARRESLRFRVASEFGIPGDKAELLLTGSDEETMRRQAEALRSDTDERKKTGNVVPNEGKTSQPKADEVREFARSLFGRGD